MCYPAAKEIASRKHLKQPEPPVKGNGMSPPLVGNAGAVDRRKTALIVEGGAMRGAWAAGKFSGSVTQISAVRLTAMEASVITGIAQSTFACPVCGAVMITLDTFVCGQPILVPPPHRSAP
mgnify:CR=1 FL=1